MWLCIGIELHGLQVHQVYSVSRRAGYKGLQVRPVYSYGHRAGCKGMPLRPPLLPMRVSLQMLLLLLLTDSIC